MTTNDTIQRETAWCISTLSHDYDVTITWRITPGVDGCRDVAPTAPLAEPIAVKIDYIDGDLPSLPEARLDRLQAAFLAKVRQEDIYLDEIAQELSGR
jgi:hypothetical protein